MAKKMRKVRDVPGFIVQCTTCGECVTLFTLRAPDYLNALGWRPAVVIQPAIDYQEAYRVYVCPDCAKEREEDA